MHRKINLKQTDTTVVDAADDIWLHFALALGDKQRVFFVLVGPDLANDRHDVFAFVLHVGNRDHRLVGCADLVADQNQRRRFGPIQRQQSFERQVISSGDASPRVVLSGLVKLGAPRRVDTDRRNGCHARNDDEKTQNQLAEREGFEPSVRFTRTTP